MGVWGTIGGAVAGGVCGFLSSMGVFLIGRHADKRGKIKVYYRFVADKDDQSPWGIQLYGSYIRLHIPAIFEIQNTSNTSRVVRDLSAELYYGKCFVAKMLQITESINTPIGDVREDKVKEKYGTEKGSYSFVIEPKSIQRQNLVFLYEIPQNEVDNKRFDRIAISYYDESDEKKVFIAKKVLAGWDMHDTQADDEWILLRE